MENEQCTRHPMTLLFMYTGAASVEMDDMWRLWSDKRYSNDS